MTAPHLVRDYREATALIAGGTSGIGLASARALADAGVRKIGLIGRSEARGAAAVAELLDRHAGIDVRFVAADATDPEQLIRAVEQVHSAFGSLDVAMCATTASYLPELLHRTSPADIVGCLRALAEPPLLLTRAAMTIMSEQGGGSIINVASDAAKSATPGEGAIGAAMAAIVMFTRVAAIEGKRQGIRVNVITPSLVAGTSTSDALLSGGFSKKLFEQAAARADLGVVTPDDVAAVAAFLAGPAAAKLTGQAISVNGGISAA